MTARMMIKVLMLCSIQPKNCLHVYDLLPTEPVNTSQFWRAEVILTRKNSDKITHKIIEL